MLTQTRLKELFVYNPVTGSFIGLVGRRRGKICGCVDGAGYLMIYIDGRSYLNHRLAFLYMLGSIPDVVDHINRAKLDNSWSNLRPATISQNTTNCKSKHNGLKGTTYDPKRKKYVAQCGGKNLGRFNTEQEAHAAYCVRAKELYGEFFRGA